METPKNETMRGVRAGIHASPDKTRQSKNVFKGMSVFTCFGKKQATERAFLNVQR